MKTVLNICIISLILYALYIPKFIAAIMGINFPEEVILVLLQEF